MLTSIIKLLVLDISCTEIFLFWDTKNSFAIYNDSLITFVRSHLHVCIYLHRATGSVSSPGVVEIKRSKASGLFNILSIWRTKKHTQQSATKCVIKQIQYWEVFLCLSMWYKWWEFSSRFYLLCFYRKV